MTLTGANMAELNDTRTGGIGADLRALRKARGLTDG